MKVKILKADKPTSWYVNSIGKEFNVKEVSYASHQYLVVNGWDGAYFILKSDCEIVHPMATKPELTDTELIEKCKERIEWLETSGNYTNTVLNITDLLTRFEKLVKEKEQLKNLLRETAMRANIAFPENDVDLNHFNQEFANQRDFMIELFKVLDLGDDDMPNLPNPPKPQKDE